MLVWLYEYQFHNIHLLRKQITVFIKYLVCVRALFYYRNTCNKRDRLERGSIHRTGLLLIPVKPDCWTILHS